MPITAGAVATFWPHRSTIPAPTPSDLAVLLRRLHALPEPPFPVPHYRPLHRLHEALALDYDRPHPALAGDDRAWLTARARELLRALEAIQSPLGEGLIHADAHRENLVRDGDEWVLIDWDQTCVGPRELESRAVPLAFVDDLTSRVRGSGGLR